MLARVAISGDGSIFTNGLKQILNRDQFVVIPNFDPSLDSAPRTDIELVLTDWCVVRDNPSENLALLRNYAPRARIVLFCSELPPELRSESVLIQVDSVLSKELAPEAVEQALQLILKGQQIFPVRFLLTQIRESNAPDNAAAEDLSRQERRILECLAAGYANKQIARELDLAEATVKTHVRNTLRKIKAANRTQAAIWAINHGMVMRNAPPLRGAVDLEAYKAAFA